MSDPKVPRRGATFETAEAPSSIRALALPDIIDSRYRILGRLGAGSMGVVLRAVDIFLDRPVAIKVVPPSDDPAVLQRFMKEAQALAQLRHENIVQVYAFGPFQQSAYLAMELVVGESLERIIDTHARSGTTVPLPRAIAFLRAIADGLDAVHARRLVHRDVKPANVIIEKGSDRPVLIDFGLARRRSVSSPKMSIVGGTPMYMAPEQAKDPDGSRVSARTDIYALACTAFELLTGRPVFEGDDIYTILLAHLSQEPRRISSVRPELAPIDDVLLRALSKEPQHRQVSASELIAGLQAGFARIGLPETDGPRVLVLASERGLLRSLVRSATSTLRGHGHDARYETAESGAEAFARIAGGSYDVLVVDEESSGGRLPELVELLRRRRSSAEVVVVSRDLPRSAMALGHVGVRHLVPKPVNVHVLAAVLGRLDLVKRPTRT